MRTAAPLMILLTALVVVGGHQPATAGLSVAGPSVVHTSVASLFVSQAKTPPIRSRFVRTQGTYPQVFLSGVSLGGVNRSLRAAILDDERQFAPQTHPRIRLSPGVYQTTPSRPLISASTVVVSALVPANEVPPAGSDGATWISVTVETATARRVGLAELFRRGSGALKALSGFAGQRLIATNACIRRGLRYDPLTLKYGLAATVENFTHYALLPAGFAIGFPAEQIAGSACGRSHVTVPYATVKPYLSRLGQKLVAGVRRPGS